MSPFDARQRRWSSFCPREVAPAVPTFFCPFWQQSCNHPVFPVIIQAVGQLLQKSSALVFMGVEIKAILWSDGAWFLIS